MVLGVGRAGVYLGLTTHLIQSNTLTDRVPDLKWTQFLPQPEAKTAEQIQVLSALAEPPNGQLYLADWKRHQIFRLKDGPLTLFAGSGQAGFKDGNAQTAQFNQIQALEADGQGNLYLLEKGSHRLRKITPDGSVSTLAGGAEAGYREGPGNEARLNQPSALAVSPEGVVFVADTGNHRIRRLEPDGHVSTFVGNGQVGVEKGEANSANALNGPRLEVAVTPTSLALGTDGTLYFSSGQHLFRTPNR
jgi:sugar lactone lactonase YvrE